MQKSHHQELNKISLSNPQLPNPKHPNSMALQSLTFCLGHSDTWSSRASFIHSVHHQISPKTRSEKVQFRVSHRVWRLKTNVNFYTDQTPLRKMFSDSWFTGRSWIFGIGNVNMLLSFDSRMLGGMWWMTCLFSPGSCFNFFVMLWFVTIEYSSSSWLIWWWVLNLWSHTKLLNDRFISIPWHEPNGKVLQCHPACCSCLW